MDSSVPSGARVFSLQKVFLIVLGFCDWATLMDVARASAHARAEVRKVVKIVIYDRLEPFLGSSSDCDALFDMLNVQGGGVLGPTVRDVFGGTKFWTLNIVVPSTRLLPCLEWFGGRGYGDWSRWPPRRQYTRTVTRFVFGEKALSLTSETYRVCVYESSTESILQVMLAGITSNHTNLLTPTRLYCAFPRVIGEVDPLKSDAPIRTTPLRFKLNAVFDNRHWKTPCGFQCPSLVRKSTSDKGIASFLWNDGYDIPLSPVGNVDSLLGQLPLSWRFSRCRNVRCNNYQPLIRFQDCRFENEEVQYAYSLFWKYN